MILEFFRVFPELFRSLWWPRSFCMSLLPSTRQISFMCKHKVRLSMNLNTIVSPWNVAPGIVLYFKHIFGLWKELVLLKAFKVYTSTLVSLFNSHGEVMGKAGDTAWEPGPVPLNRTLTLPVQNIRLHTDSPPHRSESVWRYKALSPIILLWGCETSMSFMCYSDSGYLSLWDLLKTPVWAYILWML